MTVRRMSESVVIDLAERYGVRIVWVDDEEQIPYRMRGPEGQGCDPTMRTVYWRDQSPTDQQSLWADTYGQIEHYFHELAHVVSQPPWWAIHETPEELVLFQFERSLANATLEGWAFDRVVAWQEETSVSDLNFCLGDFPYGRMPWWKLGFAIGRRVGLLDSRHRPTFRWPDWRRLAESDVEAIRRYYEAKVRIPVPRLT